MDYLGQSGDKALVNDRGRILRLPFAGDGKPPEPGTRINPNRDSCCCPKNVDLIPGGDEDNKRSDPRRVIKENDRDKKIYKAVEVLNANPVIFFLNTVYQDKEIIGKPYKLLLYPADTPIFPSPVKWVEWDCKKNTFSIVRIPGNSTIYAWSSLTAGSVFQDWNNGRFSQFIEKTGFDPKKLNTPYPGHRNQLITIKIFDTNRKNFGNADRALWGGVNRVIGSDRPEGAKLAIEKFKTSHPKGKLFGAFSLDNTIELFKSWYKNPDSKEFKYERLY